MATVLRTVGADYRIIYTGRSREQMAYLDTLEAEHGDRLEVHVRDEGSSLVVPALLETLGNNAELYMCGPIRLMDAVRRGWIDRGLPMTNLRFETFGNSGWHEPEEFTVQIAGTGVEATVRPTKRCSKPFRLPEPT